MIGTSRLEQRYAVLKRMATLCVVLVLAIAGISAFIRLSNAGLGCTDWPQCYGSKLRQTGQGVENKAADGAVVVIVRPLHRVAAMAALLTILAMISVCFVDKPVLWPEGRIALALLMLALFLAVLGIWSSNARVPAVAIGNLLGGFAMLALSWRLRQRAGNTSVTPRTVRQWARIGLVVLLCQIALGALVSAAYAGLSCTGFPDCGGSVAPGWFAQASLDAFNPWREPGFVAETAANPSGAAPHMAHRYGALAVLLALVPLVISAFTSGRRRVAVLVAALLSIEVVLGVLMVTSGLPLWAELGHNLVAAMLLAAVFSLI